MTLASVMHLLGSILNQQLHLLGVGAAFADNGFVDVSVTTAVKPIPLLH
jgi:hypothetical protein